MQTVDKVRLIKQLREQTGYGLMETKRALEQADWDYSVAHKQLTGLRIGMMQDSHWQPKEEYTWL